MLKYILIVILSQVYLYADNPIGEIVQSSHKIVFTNREYINKKTAQNDRKIYPGDNIRSAEGSYTKILLHDGTGIEIKGISSLEIMGIRLGKRDQPALLKAQYGTFIISQNNNFLDASLIFKTPSAIIKTVNASIFIIAATEETAAMVYKNRAGIANSKPTILSAIILEEGEHSFIKKGAPPSYPDKVPPFLRGSWLSKNQLSKNRENVVSQNQDRSIIDWLFRNRD